MLINAFVRETSILPSRGSVGIASAQLGLLVTDMAGMTRADAVLGRGGGPRPNRIRSLYDFQLHFIVRPFSCPRICQDTSQDEASLPRDNDVTQPMTGPTAPLKFNDPGSLETLPR